MTKLLILAPANVNHTHKWAHSLAARGYQVVLVTQHAPVEDYDSAITIKHLPTAGFKGYFLNVRAVREFVSAAAPDIIHVHYASGYGTLAGLALKQPYLLSVWGSDVYEFPFRSWFHKQWIRWSLRRARQIASTSEDMARQVKTLVPTINNIAVTPFGVDLERFATNKRALSNHSIIIGTAKKLEKRYGIDVLIKAFAELLNNESVPDKSKLRLRLVGDGSQRHTLEKLTVELGIQPQVDFVGAVASDQVASELERMDIIVLSSRIESFGVSAVEALAAKRPVIASNVGGLPEIIIHEKTGLLVPSESTEQLTLAMQRFITNTQEAQQLAQAGFEYAHENFSMAATTDRMVQVLTQFLHNNAIK